MNARLSTLLFVLVLGGCLDNRVPIEFYGLCGFPTDANTCLAPAGKCATYQNGQLYLYYEQLSSLDMVAELHNQRPDNSSNLDGRSNTANGRITEYRFKFSASPPLPLSARTLPYLSTPIPANGTSTVWVPVLPFETVAELRAAVGYNGYISVEITPRGQYGDGTTFEVAGMTFPVQVYSGVPPTDTCSDPADTLVTCPSPFQTHSSACGAVAAATTFALSGTVIGLTGSGLVLANPGLPSLPVTPGSTTFQFSTNLPDGTAYNITIQTQPSGQTCTVTGGSGTVAGSAPAGITIRCI
jgi:hypothetical protein